MPAPRTYPSLLFSDDFFSDFTRLSSSDQRRVVRAFGLLDGDEHSPGLDIHPLQGDLAGVWAARASKSLRLTFQRLADGRKLLIGCSQHYGD